MFLCGIYSASPQNNQKCNISYSFGAVSEFVNSGVRAIPSLSFRVCEFAPKFSAKISFFSFYTLLRIWIVWYFILCTFLCKIYSAFTCNKQKCDNCYSLGAGRDFVNYGVITSNGTHIFYTANFCY